MALRGKTAVAQTMQPRAYLPLIVKSGTVSFGPVHQGNATYYNATGAGNCLFPATPNDLMVAAINHVEYGVADFCGAFVRVTGRKGSVVVRIVDKCPDAGCIVGHLDLSRGSVCPHRRYSPGICAHYLAACQPGNGWADSF
ncbi:MAG: RlpA-like double-psi beta-barrel domain-containing protein [Chloroflexi bacterium]|nr:RlpA-like double-psi beta-barrel domain-containing protein [Chloroflexota bacterium]